ncbi:MAG: sulfurtransferase [Sulfuriflexus sp.]|nr:sulfurtransferase [Sulfuriflexus sp.]
MNLRHLVIFLGLLLFNLSLQAATLPGPVVDSAWLAKNLDKVVILDARKDIKSFTAKPAYKKNKKTGKLKLARVGGHIKGAQLVNYKKVRAKREIDGKTVTRMLPVKADFEKLMQAAGLSKNSAVVIVSKGQSGGDITIATRLYWQLKYYGHTDMAILDGGMAQWLKDAHKVNTKPAKASKGNWVATAENKSILATSDDVAKAVKDKSVQLVDTRVLSQYLGTYKKSYVYAKGHVPTAKVFPVELLTYPSSPAKFTPSDDLAALAREFGIDTKKPAITYCNSGHLASGAWFVMSEVLGNKQAKLYDGSMHQWTLEKRPTTAMKME